MSDAAVIGLFTQISMLKRALPDPIRHIEVHDAVTGEFDKLIEATDATPQPDPPEGEQFDRMVATTAATPTACVRRSACQREPPTYFDWNRVWTWLEGLENVRPRLGPALIGATSGPESGWERLRAPPSVYWDRRSTPR